MKKSTQSYLLGIIAACLVMMTAKLYVPEARADDNYIVERILYCIDGSTIDNNRITTYCDR